MTGKRFKTLFDNVQDGNLTIIHDVDKETAYTLNQTVELLNHLHEENTKLKWILTNYKPQDLPIPSKEEIKEFIEMLYEGDFE